MLDFQQNHKIFFHEMFLLYGIMKVHSVYSGYMYSMQSWECQRLQYLGYNMYDYVGVEVDRK